MESNDMAAALTLYLSFRWMAITKEVLGLSISVCICKYRSEKYLKIQLNVVYV
jgi:hypothetical protein